MLTALCTCAALLCASRETPAFDRAAFGLIGLGAVFGVVGVIYG